MPNDYMDNEEKYKSTEIVNRGDSAGDKAGDYERLKTDLAEIESKYRIVAEHTYDWEFWIDPAGSFLYCSPSCERISGRKAEEFLKNPDLFQDIVHPDDTDEMRKHRDKIAESSRPEEFEYRVICPDGRIKWLNHVCMPVFGREGLYLGRRGSNRDITERKQFEEVLKTQALVVENMAEGVLVAEEDGQIVFTNPTFDSQFSFKRGELVGSNISSLYAAEKQYDEVMSRIKHALGEGRNWTGELAGRTKGGEEFFTYARVSRLQVFGRNYVIYVQENITDRRISENALRDSEQRFRAIFNQAALGIVLANMEGRPIEANKAFSEMIGYSKEDLKAMTFLDFTHPDDRDLDKEAFDEMKSGLRESYSLEKRYFHKDSRIVWVHVSVSLLRGREGEPEFTIGVVTDISSRKTAESDREQLLEEVSKKNVDIARLAAYLEKERDLLQTIMENAGAKIMRLGADFIIKDVNKELEKSLGMRRDELVGANYFYLFPDDEREKEFVTARDGGVIMKGKGGSMHAAGRNQGKAAYYDWTLIPVAGPGGRVEGLVLSLFDVTERITRELSLKLNAEKLDLAANDLKKFRAAADASSDIIVITGSDKRIIYANLQAQLATGYTFEEMAGKTPALWQSSRRPDNEFHGGKESVWQGSGMLSRQFKGTLYNRDKHGRHYRSQAHIFPVVDELGVIRHYVSVERPDNQEQ